MLLNKKGVCSHCGQNLKGSKGYKMLSYWKISCINQDWEENICNLCREKEIHTPCNKTQIKWQKIKFPQHIKH